MFPWWLVKFTFSYTCWTFVCLLWEMSFQVLCLFFNCIICFLAIELLEFLLYFGCYPLVRCMVPKYFLPFCRLSLHSVDCFLCCVQAFQWLWLCYFCSRMLWLFEVFWSALWILGFSFYFCEKCHWHFDIDFINL